MTRYFKYAAAASALALLTAGVVHAQETTGGIKGTVTSDQGAAIAGATVTVVHEPTGVTTTTTTDATGFFTVTQLRVGGPYKISVSADGYTGSDTEVPYVNIGEPTESDVALQSTAAPTTVVVTGKRREVLAGRTKVGQEEIQTFPTLNRDIRDYALKSPSAYMDPTNSGALSIGGMNNRSNAILVDGVRQGDDFGLNANGLPTNRSPISVDSVESVNVDTAPYDVNYSFFQGGVINYVTKSGGNDFHGGIFYEKTGDDMRGHYYTVKDPWTGVKTQKTVTGDFEEKTWGAHLSGPIIKDKLFFFGLYEKFEGTKPNGFGASDSTASNKVPGVTNAQADAVRTAIKDGYGFDPLGVATQIPYTDEKVQGKLDWQINDNHRAVFSYEDTKSGSVNETGDSTSTSTGTLALGSKFYTLETDLKVYKGQVLSHWSDNLSTEFNVSRKEVVNISNALAGNDFAQFKVCVNTPAVSSSCSGAGVFAGPDISRQENVLTNNNTHLDFKVKYRTGSHNLLFGVEHEDIDVFNAFVQNANGAYTFNSMADLIAKKADSVTYANAADNKKADGAAQFSYSTTTLYAQDEWRVTPRFTLTYGVRFDGYSSNSIPKANSTFITRYGYTNAKGLDGLQSIQPRIKFNWKPSFMDGLTVYGGAGIFQGGNPNVWISNSYTNTGSLLGTVTCNRIYSGGVATADASCNNGITTTTVTGILDNVDGKAVNSQLQALNTASANAGSGNTNAIAPGFKMPSVWKASLGVNKLFDFGPLGDNYNFTLEYTHTQFIAAPTWVDVYMEAAKSGTAPDGRPEYFGTVGGTRANRTDVVLTTQDLGKANMVAVELAKTFHDGWADGISFDASAVFQKSTDINSGTSSVATSSYRQSTFSDANNRGAAISNYQIDTIAKLTLAYDHKFFGDNRTSFRLYNQFRTGQRFSYVFQDSNTASGASTGMYGMNSLYTSGNVELFYVPKADSSGNVTVGSDPLVTYKSGFDIAGFNTMLHKTGLIKYAGQISPRNGFKSPNNLFSNLRIMQEVPAINPHWGKLELYMDIQNIGNLINDQWDTLQQQGFPYNRFAVNATNCQSAAVTNSSNATGTNIPAASKCASTGNYYQYNSFSQSALSADNSSVYQVKVGIDYKF